MVKKTLKLINDERLQLRVKSAKACSQYDECLSYDTGTTCNANQDTCTYKDTSACGANFPVFYDICGYDYSDCNFLGYIAGSDTCSNVDE